MERCWPGLPGGLARSGFGAAASGRSPAGILPGAGAVAALQQPVPSYPKPMGRHGKNVPVRALEPRAGLGAVLAGLQNGGIMTPSQPQRFSSCRSWRQAEALHTLPTWSGLRVFGSVLHGTAAETRAMWTCLWISRQPQPFEQYMDLKAGLEDLLQRSGGSGHRRGPSPITPTH